MKGHISKKNGRYNNLESPLPYLKNLIHDLSLVKVSLERNLETFLSIQKTAKMTLVLRGFTQERDFVEDEPYVEIKKELEIIDKVVREVRLLDHDTSLQLRDMKNLANDLERKYRSMKIYQFELSQIPDSSGNIRYLPWLIGLPYRMEDVKTCMRNYFKTREDTVACAGKVVQLMEDTVAKIRSFFDAFRKQRKTIQLALRKRLPELTAIRDELEIKKKKILDEKDKLEIELKDIVSSITPMLTGNMKLSETGQENELNRDRLIEVIEEMLSHVQMSEETSEHLIDMRDNLKLLSRQLHKVEDELEWKNRSVFNETTLLVLYTTLYCTK